MNFGALTIGYDSTVLRPRPWTVMQAEWGSELLTDLSPGPVLEVGAGVGHIGFLTIHGHGRHLVAVDRSPAACQWARVNAVAHQLDVEIRCASLLDALALDERFVLITADPPWVPYALVPSFPEDPMSAIDGGPDGLDVAREWLSPIARHLHPGGWVLLQLGDTAQASRLAAEIARVGLAPVELRCATGGVVLALRHAAASRPADGPRL